MTDKRPKVLAISSGGGHWVQLLRLRPAFEGCAISYATVDAGYRTDLGEGADFHVIPNSTRWSKWDLLRSAFHVVRLLLKLRPDVVITTGAAPGYFAVRFGTWLGARCVWIDSVANAAEQTVILISPVENIVAHIANERVLSGPPIIRSLPSCSNSRSLPASP